MPTIDTAAFTQGISVHDAQEKFDKGMNISLYFLVFYSFAQGLTFILALTRVRNFNEDFNLFDEMRRYAIAWLLLTNMILFVQIQGSYSEWFSLE